MIRPLLRLAAGGLCVLALAGCISLLPKSKPVALYRFGQAPAAQANPAPAAGAVGVFRANGTFPLEAAGDRILTITGGKAAYLSDSRWVSPASVLFDQAVLEAFDVAPGPVRLISRGELGNAAYALRLDVRNFEARYDSGPKAAPTVVVRVRAALARNDKTLASEQIFEARVTADDNRVSAIAAAYD
ncbi:MAG: ABC-type transport auxiliary lipoprotein family protein, partial [Phenylobacterium sp.]